MTVRVERDRHFACRPGRCVAPVPSTRRLQGRPVGRCTPRQAWWLRVNRGGKRESFAFQTEGEARKAMEKLRAAETLGQHYAPKATVPVVPLFSGVAEKAILQHCDLNTLSPSTVRNHQSYLVTHLLPAFGPQPITPETFSRAALKDFIVVQKKGLKDGTLQGCLVTLALILDYATEHGLLASNPLRTGGRLWKKEAPEEVHPFTPEQLRSILTSAASVAPDFGTFVRVMAQTGMRPGEALALRRCDLNLDRAEIEVSGTWSGKRGRGPTKTRKSRTVSLLYPVAESRPVWRPADAGSETRAILADLRGLKVTPADPEGRLFNMSRTTVDKLWRRTLKRAGIAYAKPHTLRHSFASILLSRGGNLLAIQRAGGWASAQVLLRVYSKWIEAADTDAATTPASSQLRAQ